MADQAICAWSIRQYEEISHGATNGPRGQMLRIFLPIIDVLTLSLPKGKSAKLSRVDHLWSIRKFPRIV